MTKSGSAIGSISSSDSLSLITGMERENSILEANKDLSALEQAIKANTKPSALELALCKLEESDKLFESISVFAAANPVTEAMKALDQLSKNKSDKIRLLAEAAVPRADIARALGIRYQHVRNVLEADAAKSEAKKNKASAEADPPSVTPSSAPGLLRGKVGPGGRVVIPAPVREQLGLEEGTELVFTLEGDELRVASMTTHLKQIQEKVRTLLPQDVSLVDELIEERRREAGSN